MEPGRAFQGDIHVDGRSYTVQITRKSERPPEAPRIVVISHLRNDTAVNLLRVCISSVAHHTPEPHELWVVDNNSPLEYVEWLAEWPEINLVMNRTEPVPPEMIESDAAVAEAPMQQNWGSYANAVGLELAKRVIDPTSLYFMSMHMDAMPCKSHWLTFLSSKITSRDRDGSFDATPVAAAGVRMDRTRTPEGVLHVLGYIVDFQLFKTLDLNFFPALPALDVGDRVTIELRKAGYEVFACRNTLWNPELKTLIPDSSPWKNLHVDRSLDDDGNLIFAHLGRGLRRSSGVQSAGVSVEEFIKAAKTVSRSAQ